MEKDVLKKDFKKLNKKDKIIFISLVVVFLIIIAVGIILIIKKNDKDTLDRIEKNKKNSKEKWSASEVVKFSDEVDGNYYEYCVSLTKDNKDCLWSGTNNNELTINLNGHKYVYYKVIDSNDKVLKEDMKEVFVDNTVPVINDIEVLDEDIITVRVNAVDNISYVDKYYYSLDGENYTEGTMTNTFEGLDKNGNYTIYVKVVDAAGNTAVDSTTIGKVENTPVVPEPTPEIAPEVTPEVPAE